MYGYGVNTLLDNTTPAPPAAQLIRQAVADADQWWTRQGSAPPPASIDTTDAIQANPSASAYGYFGTGRVSIRNGYLTTTDDLLSHGSLEDRRRVLAQMWGLAAHERGHNIGYGHDPGGVMDPNLPSMPGEAYAWAAQMLPRHKVIKKRRSK